MGEVSYYVYVLRRLNFLTHLITLELVFSFQPAASGPRLILVAEFDEDRLLLAEN